MDEKTKQYAILCIAAVGGLGVMVVGLIQLNRMSGEYWQPIVTECIKRGGTFDNQTCYTPKP